MTFVFLTLIFMSWAYAEIYSIYPPTLVILFHCSITLVVAIIIIIIIIIIITTNSPVACVTIRSVILVDRLTIIVAIPISLPL